MSNEINGILDRAVWRIATQREEFMRLRPAWDRLFASNDRHSPFLAWGWMDAWLRYLASEHELKIIYLDDEGGETLFILPLHRRAGRRHPGSGHVTLICGYGPECSDRLGCICLPELEGDAATLTAKAIFQFYDRKEVISLNFLEEEGGFPTRLARAVTSLGLPVAVRSDATLPTVELPGTWDVYLKQLSSNFRSQIRRSYRKITEGESVQLQRINPNQATSFAGDLIRLNRSRMRAKGDISTVESSAFREFLMTAVPYMADNNLAWMDSIVDGDVVLGAALNFVHGRNIFFYMGGFDAKAGKVRPGTALFAAVMQRGIDRNYQTFDFLRGAEAYKYRWGASDEHTYCVTIYPKGPRGKILPVFDSALLRCRELLKTLKDRILGTH